MGKEIERKFLLKHFPTKLSIVGKKEILQFYTEISPNKEIRYRNINDTHYYRTIKEGNGLVRKENEEEISSEAFYTAKANIIGHEIQKTRYVTTTGEEIDVYHGDLKGLITMEKEFADEKEAAAYVPPVAAVEVTEDKTYKNKNLALRKGGDIL